MSTEVATLIDVTMTREKIDLIKATVAKGATDLELDLFLHACKRTGLDPLMKQIYAIKRWNSADQRETLSFQTGIDGYRLIADRTGKYAGSEEPTYQIGPDGLPEVASVTVTKLLDGMPCKFSASARWTEYVQKTKQGQPTSMWQKMPFLMLGKCAEALALRKAFPAELSGVYTHEEMMQADEDQAKPNVMDHKRTAQAKLAELKYEQTVPAQGGTVVPVPQTLVSIPQEDGHMAASSQEDAPVPASVDAPAAFIWRLGKHKGESIVTIPDDYLDWFAQNGKMEDHRDAALNELDRRRGQGTI